MKKNTKKVIAALLSASLVLSAAMPAFAEGVSLEGPTKHPEKITVCEQDIGPLSVIQTGVIDTDPNLKGSYEWNPQTNTLTLANIIYIDQSEADATLPGGLVSVIGSDEMEKITIKIEKPVGYKAKDYTNQDAIYTNGIEEVQIQLPDKSYMDFYAFRSGIHVTGNNASLTIVGNQPKDSIDYFRYKNFSDSLIRASGDITISNLMIAQVETNEGIGNNLIRSEQGAVSLKGSRMDLQSVPCVIRAQKDISVDGCQIRSAQLTTDPNADTTGMESLQGNISIQNKSIFESKNVTTPIKAKETVTIGMYSEQDSMYNQIRFINSSRAIDAGKDIHINNSLVQLENSTLKTAPNNQGNVYAKGSIVLKNVESKAITDSPFFGAGSNIQLMNSKIKTLYPRTQNESQSQGISGSSLKAAGDILFEAENFIMGNVMAGNNIQVMNQFLLINGSLMAEKGIHLKKGAVQINNEFGNGLVSESGDIIFEPDERAVILAKDYGIYAKNGVIKIGSKEVKLKGGVSAACARTIKAESVEGKPQKAIQFTAPLAAVDHKVAVTPWHSIEGQTQQVVSETVFVPTDTVLNSDGLLENLEKYQTKKDVLFYKTADYTELNKLVSEAQAIHPNQVEDYSQLQTALDAIVYDLSVEKQEDVNTMTKNIREAIDALKWKKADYTKVDGAIARAEKLNPEDYTNYDKVQNAIDAVVRNKDIREQETVNGYATAIETALTNLQLKGADYTKVDEAIDKANALNPKHYTNFNAVTSAIQSVDRNKTILEQEEVDQYAKSIETALAKLELKAADYSEVDEAIARAEKLNPEDYTNYDEVQNAIDAVVRNKDIREQETVDGYAENINHAIDNLNKKRNPKPHRPQPPVVNVPEVEINTNNPALKPVVEGVPDSVLQEAERTVPQVTVIGGSDCALDLTVTENDKEVQGFKTPILVKVKVPTDALKEVQDPSRLTLAKVERDSKGAMVLEYVGGTYDAETGYFTAKVDEAGKYILVEKDNLTKIVLTIGKTETRLNDREKIIDVAPIILGDRTMVPLRYIGEALGCRVDWNDQNRSITITGGSSVLKMTVDQEIPGYGQAPVIRNNRTLIPIRYVSEALGCNVIYDPSVREVIIVK